jgi:formamidopyrimidine-DNA glycosylase
MPEGPEMRTAADKLGRAVGSPVVTEVLFAFGHLKPCEKQMRGRRIAAVEPRGKALLIRFYNEFCVYSHNQLCGRCVIRNADAKPDYPRGTWREMGRTSDTLLDPIKGQTTRGAFPNVEKVFACIFARYSPCRWWHGGIGTCGAWDE